MFESEECDSLLERCDAGFVRVEFELKRLEECVDLILVALERSFFLVEYEEVVDIADVTLRFECVFHVLVEFVEVDVGEELACPVPERHAPSFFFCIVVFEDNGD